MAGRLAEALTQVACRCPVAPMHECFHGRISFSDRIRKKFPRESEPSRPGAHLRK